MDLNCDGLPDYQEDFDGDGVTEADGDCDDHDPLVHPRAEDPIDGIDTNCDGTDGVATVATRIARGMYSGYGFGTSLLTADVNGDGCDDLLYTESGFHTRSVYAANGTSGGLLHVRLGCTDPVQTVALEDPPGNDGIGEKLRRWPVPGRDLVVSCTSWGGLGGGVAFFDFAASPPALLGNMPADYASLWVDACAVLNGYEPELVVSHLDFVFGGGPAHGFLLDPLSDPMPSILDPDQVWWSFNSGLHIGGKVLGYDRTGDGQDELLTYSIGPTNLAITPPHPGELYVFDEPGLAHVREVWVGDIALGRRFGSQLYPAPDLPAPGQRGLLAGGATLRNSGALWLLPPVKPGDYTIADAAFELRGEFDKEWFGLSAKVGDVNGDGHVDIVVGAPWRLGITLNHPNAIDWYTGPPGKVYVFLGPFDSPVLTRADAQVFVGGQPHEGFGWAIELADLDGDGVPEIYVGAPSHGHLLPGPTQAQGLHDGALYRIDL